MTKDEFAAEAGNVKKRAVHDIKKLSRTFIGLLLIADDLDAIGDIEEAGARARKQLAQAERELADHVAKAQATMAALANQETSLKAKVVIAHDLLKEAEAKVEAARARSDDIIVQAKSSASTMTADAQAQALEIVCDARDAAAIVRRTADSDAEEREERANRLVEEKQQERDTINSEIAVLERKRADLRAAIAEIVGR